jgi:hypothetical protein
MKKSRRPRAERLVMQKYERTLRTQVVPVVEGAVTARGSDWSKVGRRARRVSISCSDGNVVRALTQFVARQHVTSNCCIYMLADDRSVV